MSESVGVQGDERVSERVEERERMNDLRGKNGKEKNSEGRLNITNRQVRISERVYINNNKVENYESYSQRGVIGTLI